MDDNRRPDPDRLLSRVLEDEDRQQHGRLKIFLGFAAGVGKTFAMLEAAHQRRKQGVDLVVGLAETHGRIETESLLEGLETIPRREITYRGVTLKEMDVDAILARRPRLALVDELAHTNTPGSRHLKRHQDVEELLGQGIDVYSTLNIQHIESLNDAVAQITGVRVRETIPDRIIDEASELELVDLPPEELLQRLREGKVYIPDQAARAVQKFFRLGNLTALREMAMRRTAERVDVQMRDYMETRAIPGPWPAKERLLVCVSPSLLSERLVRSTRRLAEKTDADWVAVYVETHEHARLSPVDKEHIARTLHLAEELGGRAITLSGGSTAESVLDYSRRHNITMIVAGKPVRPLWYELLRGSIVDQIIRKSGPIDVYVISGAGGPSVPSAGKLEPRPRPWRGYLQGLLLVGSGTAIGALIHPLFSPVNLVMVYLLAVVVAAVYLGRGPSLVVAVLSVLAFDYFFVPPRLTFAVSDSEYVLTFVALLVVGLVISNLAVQVREQAESAVHRESQTAELYALSRDLAVAVDLDTVLQAVITHVSQTLGCEAAILLPDPSSGTVVPQALTPGLELNENELAVATWAYRNAQPAGHGTDTLPAAAARYLPLETSRGVVGVLGLKPTDPNSHLSPDQLHLLDAFASQAALAVERVKLAEQAGRAEVLQATERLQTALLNSISHDLRTPLVAITGALSSLQGDDVAMNEATRRNLAENAYEEAERLNRLVGNLLDMTRIEAGALRTSLEPCDVQDVVGAALEQLAGRLEGRTALLDVPAGIPLVPMDFVLITQVLVNLLDNALKYSAADSPIEIQAHPADTGVEIHVRDRGAGIPPEDLERVFDKFYRVQRPGSVGGTGLGLSICKGILEAHGGSILASNRPGGGTVVTIALPLEGHAHETEEGRA
jgi:two-component system sensor histidine kinase KdpD